MADSLDEQLHLESLHALDNGAPRRLLALLEDNSEDQRETLKRDLLRVPLSTGSRLLGAIVAICDTDPGDCGDQWSTEARMKGL